MLLAISGLLAGAWTLGRSTLKKMPRKQVQRALAHLALFAACYLIVMIPWYGRNLAVIGRPVSTAGLQTVWLTDYDDLYSYGRPLTLQTYLDWGWKEIARSKLQALWLNAQTLLYVGWMIALAPFGLLGAWRLRRQTPFRLAGLYALLLYLAMSLVFTFPGWRGGMLHSTTALLPALYTAAMEGLDVFVHWMARRRKTWQPRQAKQFLSLGLVLLALALSAWLYREDLDRFRSPHLYERVAAWMSENTPYGASVMVNDPPLFYYHSRRPSLAIPNAELDTVLTVMDHYNTPYLLLDADNPSLEALYRAPESSDRLLLLKSFDHEETTAYLFHRLRE